MKKSELKSVIKETIQEYFGGAEGEFYQLLRSDQELYQSFNHLKSSLNDEQTQQVEQFVISIIEKLK
jgi:Mn-containing catalase